MQHTAALHVPKKAVVSCEAVNSSGPQEAATVASTGVGLLSQSRRTVVACCPARPRDIQSEESSTTLLSLPLQALLLRATKLRFQDEGNLGSDVLGMLGLAPGDGIRFPTLWTPILLRERSGFAGNKPCNFCSYGPPDHPAHPGTPHSHLLL